ncbi:MAG: thioredoxin domain-containing protein, partial [Planctomycetota bacterium]
MMSVGNREKSLLDRGWWVTLYAAWCILCVPPLADKAVGCNARSVKMFVGKTQAEAETSSNKSLSL